MNTDWNLIRQAINTAIDSCEKLERAGFAEHRRGATAIVDGRRITVQEFLISAWTIAGRALSVIRERHARGMDLPYVPESARILIAVAAACPELIGAGEQPPAEDHLLGMARWFRDHFDPYVEHAIAEHVAADSPDSSASAS